MIDRDEALRLFDRRREAYLSEDFDTYLNLFSEGVVLQTPMGEPVRGRDAYGELVRRSARTVRPVSFEFHEIAVHDSKVLSEWTITLERRADGVPMSYRGMSICELTDGRISRWREYFNPADLRLT
jgi:limonene-1,2-epoxide hydrolase